MINQNIFNKNQEKPRILISPLDWGLGHATRCIPIIRELIKQNCEVFIASDKKIFSLLKEEFPGIVFLQLKGYEIEYSNHKRLFAVKMALQLPKIVLAIRNENKWLKKAIKEHRIDAVISDNRFGMYSKDIPCIYITHQLFTKTGNRISEKIARKIHNFFIKKYTNCWVPDFKEDGLAGALSHPRAIISNVIYIGPLSRFHKLPALEKEFDILFCLSGPEPQRTLFEKVVLLQLKNYPGKALVVRGLPGEKQIVPTPAVSVTIVNHLGAEELNQAFEISKMVISRSGYTTIMDLVQLGKRAILIPTPGQAEQEYLAKYLSEKNFFYSIDQKFFSLDTALIQERDVSFVSLNTPAKEYKKVINEFVLSLKTGNFASQ